MSIIFKHTLKSAGKNPGQTVIIILTMIIITACILLAASLNDTIFANTELWTNCRFGYADAELRGYDNPAKVNELCKSNEDKLLGTISLREAGVVLYSSDTTYHVEMKICDDVKNALKLSRTQVLQEKQNTSSIPSITISTMLSKALNIEVGDNLTLQSDNETLNGKTVFFVNRITEDRAFMYNQASFTIMTDAFEVGTLENEFRVFLFYLNDSYKTQNEKDSFKQQLVDSLDTPAFTVLSNDSEELAAASNSNTETLLNIGVLLIVIMMAFILFFSYSVIAKNRATEIARFKAAGATPVQCVMIMLFEVVIYAIIGCSTGLGVGYAVAKYAHNMIAISSLNVFSLSVGKYFLALFIGFAASLISCLIPATRLSRKETRELTSGGLKISAKQSPISLVVLSILLAVGFTLTFTLGRDYLAACTAATAIIGCGWIISITPYLLRGICFLNGKVRKVKEGKIATFATPRNSSIVTVTVMLAIVIGFAWAGATVIDLLKTTSRFSLSRFTSDYTVIYHDISTEECDDALAALLAVDGITDGCSSREFPVTGFYLTDANGNSTEIKTPNCRVYAVKDGDSLKYHIPECSTDLVQDFNSTEHPVVLPYSMAMDYGVKVGDKITFIYNHQLRLNSTYTIAALDTYITSYDVNIFINQADAENEKLGNITHFFLNGSKDAFLDLRTAANEIDENCIAYRTGDYFIDNNTVKGVDAFYDFIMAFFYGVAALGLVNLIIVTAIDRRKEMQIFSLIGMTQAGAFRMTLTEAMLVTLTGWLTGTAIATAFNNLQPVFARLINKYVITPVFPVDMAVTTLVAAAICFTCWVLSPLVAANIIRKRDNKSIHSAD